MERRSAPHRRRGLHRLDAIARRTARTLIADDERPIPPVIDQPSYDKLMAHREAMRAR